MAKKTSNINLPDGTTVSIPTWASESTMEQAVNYMAASNKVDQKFLTLMKGLGSDIGGLQKSISDLVQPVKQNAKNDAKSKQDDISLAKGIKGTASAVMKASSFFGNTDAPLTGMVNATGELTDKMKTAGGDFFSSMLGEGNRFSGALQFFGGAVDVAADAALAYAGWNAAKLEQFAEAQKKMIDAGAIFYSSGDQFDMLYSSSMDAGITYNQMIDTVGQFGGTMTALGGSVSAGAVNFVDMFERLNDAADDFGDLGLSSKEMAGQYAEFLEYSRLTGTMNRQLVDGGEQLNRSFINLQIESTGLANLTALSKSEAMRRQMDALTQPLVVLGTSSLEERGFPGSAEVVRGITSRLGLIAPDNEVFQMLMDGFAQEVAETTDPANFELGKRLDPNFRAALQAVTPGLIDNINNMVRSGSSSAEEAGDMLFQALSEMDMESVMTAGALPGSALKYITQLQAAGHKYNLDFQAYNDMTAAEREQYRVDIQDKMNESGKSVQMMNDVTETFLNLQDSLTLPLQDTYQVFDDLTGMLSRGADRVREFFGFDDNSGFGDYMDPMDTQGNYELEAFGNNSTFSPQSTSAGSTPTRTVSDVWNEIKAARDTHDRGSEERTRLNRLMNSIKFGTTTLEQAESLLSQVNNPNSTSTASQSDTPNSPSTSTEVNPDVNDPSDTPSNNTPSSTPPRTVTATEAWDQLKVARDTHDRGSEERSRLNGLMNRINKTTTTPDEAAAILREANLNGLSPQNRRMGGPVTANQPYIVGDQLGMDNAELFIPETSGNIVNNRDLNTMISNLVNGQGDLTSGNSSAIIEELKHEYQSIIESKSNTVRTMVALREAIRLFNDNKNRKSKIDIINSV